MQVLNFIINNILTQASIIIALIALLGLVLQKKPVGAVISGTMKTMLGFLVLSAGSAVIVSSLTYFGDIFKAAFGLKGLVASIEGINGQAMNELGLGSEIAITLAGIHIPDRPGIALGGDTLCGIRLLLWINRCTSDHHRKYRGRILCDLHACLCTAYCKEDHGQ